MRYGVLLALMTASVLAARAQDPDEMQRALGAFSKGKLAESRDAFARLAKRHPDDPLIQLNLGTVQFRMNELANAAKSLELATVLDPDNKAAWLTLGLVCMKQDREDDALAALSRAVQLDPRNSRAHAYLGLAIGQRGWLLGAEQELRRALDLEPNYAEAHFNLALFYLRRNPPAVELARRHYERAVALGSAPDPLVEKELAPPPAASPAP